MLLLKKEQWTGDLLGFQWVNVLLHPYSTLESGVDTLIVNCVSMRNEVCDPKM